MIFFLKFGGISHLLKLGGVFVNLNLSAYFVSPCAFAAAHEEIVSLIYIVIFLLKLLGPSGI